jgi:hypothetical protein
MRVLLWWMMMMIVISYVCLEVAWLDKAMDSQILHLTESFRYESNGLAKFIGSALLII